MGTTSAAWAVVGAGPAGIASVAKLLTDGVAPAEIVWLDPAFAAGDLGRYWAGVSSNTRVALFHRYFEQYPCFEYDKIRSQCRLATVDSNKTCQLSLAVDVLLKVIATLKQKVRAIECQVEQLSRCKAGWRLILSEDEVIAKQVILATGAEPKHLSFDDELAISAKQISLCDALDGKKLLQRCEADEVVAVFGNSHSAVLIMRDLIENGRQVINFYRTPLKYAVQLDGWTLFDNTGLKGVAADWARENIVDGLTKKLTRFYSNKENLAKYLPVCDKVICAVGFQARNELLINGLALSYSPYNPHNGIIAPGLFGVGIGFPEKVIDKYHNAEHAVGMWKFVDYLERLMPLWREYR